MFRMIGAGIAGYAVLAFCIFLSFTIAYLAMGTERAFRPGTFEPSGLWLVTSFVLGFVAAMIGGRVCSTIGRTAKASRALAGVVLVLGLLLAIPNVTASRPASQPVRTGDVGNMDAMQKAQQPAWVALLNPVIGAVGVLVGGRLRGGAAPAAAEA